MICAILADDEVLARRKLRQLLRGTSEIEISGECGTASETIELAKAINPDLISWGIFSKFHASNPRSDSHDRVRLLCLRAFEIDAVDYLLKPFAEDRLQKRCDAHQSRWLIRAVKEALVMESNNGGVESASE